MKYYFSKHAYHQLQDIIPSSDEELNYSELEHLPHWRKFFRQFGAVYTESLHPSKPNHFGCVEFTSEKQLTFLALANTELYHLIMQQRDHGIIYNTKEWK